MKRKVFYLFLSVSLFILLTALPVCAANGAEQTTVTESTVTVANVPLRVEDFFAFIEQYANELLSGLCLFGSLLVAFIYKKGILPLLRSGLSSLNHTASQAEQLTESFTARAEEEIAAIREHTRPVAEILEKTEKCMESMEKALAESERAQKETRRILAAETELFYELLSAANLPQVQKESMANTYYALRNDLNDAEENS